MTDPSPPAPAQPLDRELAWLRDVYRPGVPQLTARAVVVGMLLGGVMCLSNLYVFFKTGWSMGVTITAAILAFAVFRALEASRLTRRPLTALENNALVTVSSGAGYMTGGGNMAAFGALLMITPVRPDAVPMIAWFATIAALGVFCAIPIKRQLINREGLAFPTGTATAETLRAIHGEAVAAPASPGAAVAGSEGGVAARGPANAALAGGGGAIAPAAARSTGQAKALGIAAAGAALLTWLRDAKATWIPYPNVPSTFPLPWSIAGRPAAEWTLTIKTEVVLVGAGALMSWRTAWSVLVGSVLTYAVLAPQLHAEGLIPAVNYKSIVGWTVWPGASLLVAAALTSFAFDWRSVARSFSGLAGLFRRKVPARTADPMEAVEVPPAWFPLGFMVLGPIVVVLMMVLFSIPWWAGVVAVPLAVVMGFVAARVTGDTDVTPTKALGPVTQLLYGVITPGNLPGNIMSANVTGGIGLHAADLLTTIKTGWILGANPRVQFYAQLIGVVAGAAIIVPAFNLIMPDPSELGGERWPAPSCVLWAGVSKAFANGIGALDAVAQKGILVGALLGIALALLEKLAPLKARPFVPSPSGLGIAMVIPGSNGIAMFLGGLAAEILRRYRRQIADRFVTPVASGLIAGESLMGVAVAMGIVSGVFMK